MSYWFGDCAVDTPPGSNSGVNNRARDSEWPRMLLKRGPNSVPFYDGCNFVGRINGDINGLLDGPTSLQAGSDCSGRHMEFLCPGRQGQAFPVGGQDDIVSSVGALLDRRSPSAVVGTVRTVDVDSVKCMGRGGLISDICDKISYIMPSFADEYSTPTVKMECFVLGVITPHHHALPSVEERVLDQAVLGAAPGAQVSLKATAGVSVSAGEVPLANKLCGTSAIALDFDHKAALGGLFRADSKNNKLSISVSNYAHSQISHDNNWNIYQSEGLMQ